MYTSLRYTVLQRTLAFVIAVALVGWLTVPALMTPSSFLALLGFIAVSAWVVKTTYQNAQPASSLAQSFYDADAEAAALDTPLPKGR